MSRGMGYFYRQTLVGATGALLTLTVLAGCGPSEEEMAAEQEAEREAAFSTLREEKQALDEQRSELRELRQQLAEAGEDAAGEDATEELSTQVNQLKAEIDTAAGEFVNRLVEFINEDPPEEGAERTPIQREAFRMMSDEDMIIAREYIELGGNYQKAIQIYTEALRRDPDNADLQAALADAERMRYMDEERFAAVKTGMDENEVKAALGTPNIYNVREYEDRGVTAWFYPKAEDGSAAAVWFESRNDKLVVYKVDFNALSGREAEEEAS